MGTRGALIEVSKWGEKYMHVVILEFLTRGKKTAPRWGPLWRKEPCVLANLDLFFSSLLLLLIPTAGYMCKYRHGRITLLDEVIWRPLMY